MPNLPRCAGAALFQRMQPLFLAGTTYADNTELGFPTGAGAITNGVRVDSSPILVAGLTGFMFLVQCDGNFTVQVSHCDPFSDLILVTYTLTGALAGGVVQTITIGRGGSTTTVTNTGGHVWHTLRMGLTGLGANRTFASGRLLGVVRG